MKAKADLHVHSKHSDRPSEWLLRRIGAPESFVEPKEVYERCRARGMQFVTITDHNCIDGALDIAHLPGTFVSAEVTTYFPENGCKIHCLVHDVTEAQFENIQQVRPSIYELRDYLIQNGILHSVAHPFFQPNDRLTLDQFEKLLVLFNRFELINGTERKATATVLKAIFNALTPELIERMADRHNLEPLPDTPWRKRLTGGSDDHSGLYSGQTYTETPPADSTAAFLEHLRCGRHKAGGSGGTSLQFAHSLYHIAYAYYQNRLLNGSPGKVRLLGAVFEKVLGTESPSSTTWGAKLSNAFKRFALVLGKQTLSPTERMLVDASEQLMADREETDAEQHHLPGDERAFRTACHLCHGLSFSFMDRCIEHAQQGDLINSIQTLASLAPLGLGIAPYLAAFGSRHKNQALVNAAAVRFGVRDAVRSENRKVWLADTLMDGARPDRAIEFVKAALPSAAPNLTVVTCCEQPPTLGLPVENFAPVGFFDLPTQPPVQLPFPPFLEVVEYVERMRFNEVLTTGPGPLGLTAMMAARLLGLQVTVLYARDLQGELERTAPDQSLTRLARRYVDWFTGLADRVVVRTETQRERLRQSDIEAETVACPLCPADAEEAPAERNAPSQLHEVPL